MDLNKATLLSWSDAAFCGADLILQFAQACMPYDLE